MQATGRFFARGEAGKKQRKGTWVEEDNRDWPGPKVPQSETGKKDKGDETKRVEKVKNF